ncbi:MAG TPA: hypothetical protein VHZ76_10420 [Gammaproteobacteria bacterium]|jgi:hypothetical protein|nr:hypothetical protein [Gammaproteobacteria bacterium]
MTDARRVTHNTLFDEWYGWAERARTVAEQTQRDNYLLAQVFNNQDVFTKVFHTKNQVHAMILLLLPEASQRFNILYAQQEWLYHTYIGLPDNHNSTPAMITPSAPPPTTTSVGLYPKLTGISEPSAYPQIFPSAPLAPSMSLDTKTIKTNVEGALRLLSTAGQANESRRALFYNALLQDAQDPGTALVILYALLYDANLESKFKSAVADQFNTTIDGLLWQVNNAAWIGQMRGHLHIMVGNIERIIADNIEQTKRQFAHYPTGYLPATISDGQLKSLDSIYSDIRTHTAIVICNNISDRKIVPNIFFEMSPISFVMFKAVYSDLQLEERQSLIRVMQAKKAIVDVVSREQLREMAKLFPQDMVPNEFAALCGTARVDKLLAQGLTGIGRQPEKLREWVKSLNISREEQIFSELVQVAMFTAYYCERDADKSEGNAKVEGKSKQDKLMGAEKLGSFILEGRSSVDPSSPACMSSSDEKVRKAAKALHDGDLSAIRKLCEEITLTRQKLLSNSKPISSLSKHTDYKSPVCSKIQSEQIIVCLVGETAVETEELIRQVSGGMTFNLAQGAPCLNMQMANHTSVQMQLKKITAPSITLMQAETYAAAHAIIVSIDASNPGTAINKINELNTTISRSTHRDVPICILLVNCKAQSTQDYDNMVSIITAATGYNMHCHYNVANGEAADSQRFNMLNDVASEAIKFKQNQVIGSHYGLNKY